MTLKRLFSIISVTVLITLSVIVLMALLGYIIILPGPIHMFLGGMRPAPPGIHGQYGEKTTYTLPLSKDNIINRIKALGFDLQLEQLQDYDLKDTHRRFEIRNLICGQDTVVPLFDISIDKSTQKTQIELLWIEGKPTKDEQEYSDLEEQFYNCFENQIIEKLK